LAVRGLSTRRYTALSLPPNPKQPYSIPYQPLYKQKPSKQHGLCRCWVYNCLLAMLCLLCNVSYIKTFIHSRWIVVSPLHPTLSHIGLHMLECSVASSIFSHYPLCSTIHGMSVPLCLLNTSILPASIREVLGPSRVVLFQTSFWTSFHHSRKVIDGDVGGDAFTKPKDTT